MKNDYFRYYHPKLLIPLLVFLGISLYLGNKFSDSHWGVSASIIAIITLLLSIIDKRWWRYKPFSYLFWSINIEGRYNGTIEYKDLETGEFTKKSAVIEISQTGSSIKLQSYFGEESKGEQSISKSLYTSLITDEHGEYTIVFTYLNEGNLKLGFDPHYGTTVLSVKKHRGKVSGLKGHYYTSRSPIQTKGTIQVDYITKISNQG